MIQENNLSKFIFGPLDDDELLFEAIDNVDDGVPIPSRRASRGNPFRIQRVGDAIWIRAGLPEPVDKEEIFVLTRIGYDLPLEVAEAVVGANIGLDRVSYGLRDRERPVDA